MICTILWIILIIFLIWVFIKIAKWLMRKGYHHLHPDRPVFKRGLARAVLRKKYGKREGKKLFKEIEEFLWKNHRIK